MEVHRQTCQSCGSQALRNLVVREPGEPQVVLVACAQCEQLVARYELRGYYHHGKGIEAWLPHVAVSTESSIDLADAFAQLRERAPEELAEALAALAAQGKRLK